MNVFELHDVRFAYNPHLPPILDGLDLEIGQGVRTAILGANGAGKTTLFNTLTGVNRPQSGEVLYNGSPVAYSREGLMDIRSDVAVVLQNPDEQIFNSLVEEDVAFGPLNIGLSIGEVEERVEKALRDVRLTGLDRRPLQQLSGGQRKRVAIAGALAMDPGTIIMDEPTAGLDPQAAVEVMELAEKLSLRGVTVLISTHDMDLAFKWADKTSVLCGGKVAFSGMADDLFSDTVLTDRCGLVIPSILGMNGNISAIRGTDPAPYPHSMCEFIAKFGGSKGSGMLTLVPAPEEEAVPRFDEMTRDRSGSEVGIFGPDVRFQLQHREVDYMFEGLDCCFAEAVKGRDAILLFDPVYMPTVQRQIDRIAELGFDLDYEVVG